MEGICEVTEFRAINRNGDVVEPGQVVSHPVSADYAYFVRAIMADTETRRGEVIVRSSAGIERTVHSRTYGLTVEAI